MKVLIIGSGGREHAIGWKLLKSPKVSKLYFAPGNGGTLELGENLDINVLEFEKIADFAKKNKIGLVVVGPDDPLALGLVDYLYKKRIKAFGPTKKAAEIESSKAFAKKLMKEERIPTAKWEVFNDFKNALKFLKKQNFPIVIKASGLALGKGVTVVKNLKQGEQILKEIMIDKIFGKAGNEVVIEEFLKGREVSIHLFSDGRNFSIFPPSEDHKPIFDKDKGPNTGGMGAVAPLDFVDDKLMEEIKEKIVIPTLKGFKKRNRKFIGILYPGLMITKDGAKVLEFNARFGDPEAESYMRLLKTDLLDIFLACINGRLDKVKIDWDQKFACNIVLASGGYPGEYKKGLEIKGIKQAERLKGIVVFHAGTKFQTYNQTSNPGLSTQFQTGIGKLITSGGRVLGVSAVGNTLDETLNLAYNAIRKIHFQGMQYRKDIGKRLYKW